MLQAIQLLASEPGLSSSTSDPVLQLDELSIACTNEICNKILALYDIKELNRSGGDKRLGKSLRVLMKNVEIISSSNSSSWYTTSTSSHRVSTMTPPGSTMPSSRASTSSAASASSAAQSESSFSDEFWIKASEAISEVLLKSELKLSPVGSLHTSDSVWRETEPDLLIEQAKATARQILQNFFKIVRSLQGYLSEVTCNVQSGLKREQKILAHVRKIHMDIHNLVSSYIFERTQSISLKSKMLVDVHCQTGAETCGSSKNSEESAAAEQFLKKATEVASSILLNRLSSHISTSVIGERSWVSGAKRSSMASSDQDSVGVHKTEQGLNGEVGGARLDAAAAPSSHSAAQTDSFTPLHVFTAMQKYLEKFLTSIRKNVKVPAHSESEQEEVIPTRISEDGTIHEHKVPTIGHSLSDSALHRRTRLLNTAQFPPVLIFKFVDISTEAILQNVLNLSSTQAVESSQSQRIQKSKEQKVQHRRKLRCILKRQFVVKLRRPKKQRRTRVPVLHMVNRAPSVPSNLNDVPDSPRDPRAVRTFTARARRQLGKVFSRIGRTCNNLFK